MYKTLIIIIILFTHYTNSLAHENVNAHWEDIMDVFGFEYNTKTSPKTQQVNAWITFISSEMIDKQDYHKELKAKYPELTIGGPMLHRLLFHWGYNAVPWSKDLEDHIIKKCYDKDIDATIKSIKSDLKKEQRRRNQMIKDKTEKTFGFAHGGTDAKYTNFFASMAYNIHLLGDQQTDNTVFKGVPSTSHIIEQIILSMRMLDNNKSRPIEKQLTILNKQISDEHNKADEVMRLLKKVIPSFIKSAQNGSIYRRLEKSGLKIKN